MKSLKQHDEKPAQLGNLWWCRSVGVTVRSIHPLLRLLGQVQDVLSNIAIDAGRK